MYSVQFLKHFFFFFFLVVVVLVDGMKGVRGKVALRG